VGILSSSRLLLSPRLSRELGTAARRPNRATRLRRTQLIWFLGLSLVFATLLPASDVRDMHGQLIGHPRARFPLSVYLEDGSTGLNPAVQEAVAQWNKVFEHAFKCPAFAWTEDRAKADVLIRFARSAGSNHHMGSTNLEADGHGVIRLPVTILLNTPHPRGNTDAWQMLFDVAAHELGHALGLPHINQPNLIMCCDPKAVNFHDPAIRRAYINARRHPNLESMEPELAHHYREFWGQN
jgi:hypothetical protein